MALKRRRRKFEAALVCLLSCLISSASCLHQQQPEVAISWPQQQQQQPAVASGSKQQKAGSSQAPIQELQSHSTSHFCSMLPEEISRQLKLCKLIRHSAPASEAVSAGASKGLAECRAQFSRDRWNCTHLHGEPNLLVGELAQSVGNRESAFVQAIAAAGIVHSIATACSAGSLSDCACDKSRVGPIKRQDEIWKWGGCSNNIRHGMLFAKHLVELLDAVHQHHFLHQLKNTQKHHHQHHLHHNRQRRSTGSGRQLRAGRPPLPELAPATPEVESFCKHNHSISQTTHKQLIKSLLAEHSLERHQEIRLAVNMHNNKIGRTAVAKNMELRCRCHGLSGSCSLKTCWLTLPNFQVIGNYLKGKYEASVHIPTALNLNKLIPLMDRAEIAAILSNKWQQVDSSPDGEAVGEFAALPPAGGNRPRATPPPSYSYYRQLSAAHNNRNNSTTIAEELYTDIPLNTSPMTQQQYQALLREMKLCTSNATGSALLTDDGGASARSLTGNHHRKYHLKQQQHEGHLLLKQANQALSQMLHPHDKDALLHLHKSPAYCEPDQRRGFPGISSRLCSKDRNAPDSCDKLCCGRGSRTLTYKESYKCDCKFQYCCSINCSVCEQTMQVAVCN